MIVIPAVDVRGGRCVRLLRGDYAQETVYSDDPTQQAMGFVRRGATRVHIVDLDAARGQPDVLSRDAVRAAVRALRAMQISVQVGGGVRSAAAAASWLEAGADYIVLGSLAVREPWAAEEICRANPDHVLLGLDVRGDVAQAQGWTESAGDAAIHLERWRSWPAAGVIRTDVGRDGALLGPDVDGLRDCAERYRGPVIASGGIATMDDLDACAEAGAAGVIVGRALYEGRLDLSDALARHSAMPAGGTGRTPAADDGVGVLPPPGASAPRET
ncbi:MAG TPA: 1-(5-phosphoribosyl)-5-[(5-phosphoribosylamino)methylideneamino] imidazole-4-carboxamide isomerase [Candidatus Dormibacteraeota bacterium]|jgi:phosphoribosylformimino-5-aminoimidazole carboxamide ribotide isomerase|nr:1-(5-phosphoribosyl)-5-[(5-phosphoribosylamino)methylideneamino] imidazole-4-carboxamide isomerase [Candidatus Dormibacteraeota bacterium]